MVRIERSAHDITTRGCLHAKGAEYDAEGFGGWIGGGPDKVGIEKRHPAHSVNPRFGGAGDGDATDGF